jgi:hypothetical protein
VSETRSWLAASRYATPDVRAWELLKRSNERHETWTEEGYRDGIRLAREALGIDPEYPQAHAAMASGYYMLWAFGFDPREELRKNAKASAERAVELEPTNEQGQELLAHLSMRESDWEGAETRLVRALEAKPSDGPLRFAYGWLLLSTDRVQEGTPHLQRAVALNPTRDSSRNTLGVLHVLEGNYEAAIQVLEESSHPWPVGPVHLAYAHHLNGDDERASEALIEGYASSPEVAAAWRATFAEGGLEAVHRAVLDQRVAQTGRACTTDHQWVSQVLAFIGAADRMFDCMDESIRLKRIDVMANFWPVYDPYRDDPRFIALLRRMNLAEE